MEAGPQAGRCVDFEDARQGSLILKIILTSEHLWTGESDEAAIRAAQVAEQDDAAADREESAASSAAHKKAKRLTEIARQKKAYGLRGRGQAVGQGTVAKSLIIFQEPHECSSRE